MRAKSTSCRVLNVPSTNWLAEEFLQNIAWVWDIIIWRGNNKIESRETDVLVVYWLLVFPRLEWSESELFKASIVSILETKLNSWAVSADGRRKLPLQKRSRAKDGVF